MIKRRAKAVWQGTGKEGTGSLETPSGVFNETPYSFAARFLNEDGKAGTNPEELIAAAHAGCFSMKLAFNLNDKGYTAEKIETSCVISMEEGTLTESHLKVLAVVPGLDDTAFHDLVADAEKNCPISKVLNLQISVDATLG